MIFIPVEKCPLELTAYLPSYHHHFSLPSCHFTSEGFSYRAHSWGEEEPAIFDKRPWSVSNHIFNVVIEAPGSYQEEEKEGNGEKGHSSASKARARWARTKK